MRCNSVVRSLYIKIFSASFLITFLSPEIATSINMHVLFSLSRIIMSGLLLGIVLSVCTCWFTVQLLCPLGLLLLSLVHVRTSVFVQLHPYFLAYVEVYYYYCYCVVSFTCCHFTELRYNTVESTAIFIVVSISVNICLPLWTRGCFSAQCKFFSFFCSCWRKALCSAS